MQGKTPRSGSNRATKGSRESFSSHNLLTQFAILHTHTAKQTTTYFFFPVFNPLIFERRLRAHIPAVGDPDLEAHGSEKMGNMGFAPHLGEHAEHATAQVSAAWLHFLCQLVWSST